MAADRWRTQIERTEIPGKAPISCEKGFTSPGKRPISAARSPDGVASANQVMPPRSGLGCGWFRRLRCRGFGIAGRRFGLRRARWREPFVVKGLVFDIVEKRKGCAGGGAFGAVRMRISKEVNSEPMQVVRCQDFAGRSARKDRRG